MKYLIWIAAVAGLVACNRHNEDFDPNNHATARRNGEKWEADVRVEPFYYDSTMFSIYVTQDLADEDFEALYFERIPVKKGIYYLNRPQSQSIFDSLSTYQRFYRSHVGESAYSVRHEGDENNWLRIDSYDPNTGRLEATFQGTYVKCDYKFDIYGGDSIIFTEGKLVGVLKP